MGLAQGQAGPREDDRGGSGGPSDAVEYSQAVLRPQGSQHSSRDAKGEPECVHEDVALWAGSEV